MLGQSDRFHGDTGHGLPGLEKTPEFDKSLALVQLQSISLVQLQSIDTEKDPRCVTIFTVCGQMITYPIWLVWPLAGIALGVVIEAEVLGDLVDAPGP